MKKYDIIEKLRIVKDILNVFRNDAKRSTSLTNKFKKLDFKYVADKDGTITAITIKDIPDDTFNIFLDSANSNARSEKVKNLLSDILDNKASVADIKKEKSPAKKAKPVKEAKAAKEKAETKTAKTKITKKKEAKEPKEKSVSGLIDERIAAWVNGTFNDEMLKKMQGDILDSFRTDSRLNITMENWMKKSSDLKTQVINMFTTAYTRKPNNGKMKNAGWYINFDQWNGIELPEKSGPVKESKEPKEPKEQTIAEVIEKDAIKKVKENVKEKEAAGPEMYTYTLNVYDSLFAGIRCNRGNVSKINGSFREKDIEQIIAQFSLDKTHDIKEITYSILFPKLPERVDEDEVTTRFALAKEIFKVFVSESAKNQSTNQLFEEESEMFSTGLENVFVTNIILNLIFCTSGGIGFGSNQLRGEILEAITSKLTLSNKTRDADKICQRYLEDANQLNQIELYTLNRKIVKAALEIIVKNDTIVPYFNLLGQFVMNSLMVKNNTNNLIITRELSDENSKEAVEDGEIKYTVTSREISFVFQGTSFNIPKNNENYSEIYQAVVENDHVVLDGLVTSQQKLTENIKTVVSTLNEGDASNIHIKIVDKTIYCNNKIFKGLASMEFIKYVAENNTRMISQFKRFMFNCSLNPSNASVEELYDFVVKNRLKVTPAGTILLYKWVNDKYHDCRTGNFNNTPGLTIKMDRKKVNPNRHETCSNGLHLCSYKYGKFGDRLLLVELDPKNSVSIPSDYGQSKMRCCEYTSLMDITEFVSVMDKEGDFLSKVENVHYNTKILEMELMKMYPDVVRKNSINGLNELTGKDQDKISEIALNFEIPELQVIDVTENDEYFAAECEIEKEEIKEELSTLKPSDLGVVDHTKNNKVDEQEDISIIDNLELFLNCKDYNSSILNEKNYDEIVNKLKVIDEVIFGYAIQRVEKKPYENTAAKLLDLMTVFRYIKHDEVSISEISDEAKTNANQLKLAEGTKNPDEVVVYETPKESSVLNKIGKIFKKLW